MSKMIYVLIVAVVWNFPIFSIPSVSVTVFPYRLALMLAVIAFIVYFFKEILLKRKFYNFIRNFTPVHWFFIIFSLWSLISGLWAIDSRGWIRHVYFVTTGSFIIIFFLQFVKKSQIKNIFYLFIGASFIHHLIGWYELLTSNYIYANSITMPRSKGIPVSSLANQNNLATLLLASMTISLILFLNSKINWVKLILFFYLLSSLILIIKTESKIILISWLLILIFSVLIKLLSLNFLKNIFILSVVPVFIALIIFSTPNFIRDNFILIINKISSGSGSLTYRLNMIRNGFTFFFNSKFLGIGAGNVEHYMTNNAVFKVDAPNMHNWFIELLVNYGLFIFILYIILWIYMIISLVRIAKSPNNHFIIITATVLGSYCIVYPLLTSASSSNFIIEWHWIFKAIILAFIQIFNGSYKFVESKQLIQFDDEIQEKRNHEIT